MSSAKKSVLGEELRSAYIPHPRVQQDPGGLSLTRQEFAEECDVNALMARYEKAGEMWHIPPGREPVYLDCTQYPGDLMSAMQVVKDAEVAFMTLPATVRREFNNDPLLFVDFAQQPENLDQLREWGLAEPAAVKTPAPGAGSPPVAPGAPADGESPKGSSSSAGSTQ